MYPLELHDFDINNKDLWTDINQVFYNNAPLQERLGRYLYLTKFPEQFSKEPGINIYYSRLYWFNQTFKEYVTLFGVDDLNLRQQLFQLLEQGEQYENIDWRIVEVMLGKGL